MTTNVKFEEFCTSHRDEHGLCFFTVKKPFSDQYVDSGTRNAWLGWQASLSSLQVTPELVGIYCSAVNEYLGSLTQKQWLLERTDPTGSIHRAAKVGLTAVFAAIKDGKS